MAVAGTALGRLLRTAGASNGYSVTVDVSSYERGTHTTDRRPVPWCCATTDRRSLQARSLDRRAVAQLEPGAYLSVHSVFERAINLRSRDGALLTLVGRGGRNGPATVVLDALLEPACSSALNPGLPAMVDNAGRLTIGDALVIDVAKATVWRRPWLGRSSPTASLRKYLALAAGLAYQLQGSQGLGPLLPHLSDLLSGPSGPPPTDLASLPRAAWEALASLLPGWRRGDVEAVTSAAKRLVGLGPGQTPSGDDLLAGFIVAERRICSFGPRKASPSSKRRRAVGQALGTACLQTAVGRTTDLGLARLRHAVEGDLDERSELMLAALLSGERPAVEAATRELLAFGHSSGVDTLVGILLGVGFRVSVVGGRPDGERARGRDGERATR
jgi:Protein of unknown function (DUF2877)